MVPYLALLCAHSLSEPLEFILWNLLFVKNGFLQPSLSRTCHCKGKSIWECIGTSYGMVSGSTVCPFTLKTTGIYSPTFIICAQVVFATLIFQNLPLKGKIYLRLYRDLLWYLIWLYYVLIHHKGKFIWECIGTSYGTLSGSIMCSFTTRENLFENA